MDSRPRYLCVGTNYETNAASAAVCHFFCPLATTRQLHADLSSILNMRDTWTRVGLANSLSHSLIKKQTLLQLESLAAGVLSPATSTSVHARNNTFKCFDSNPHNLHHVDLHNIPTTTIVLYWLGCSNECRSGCQWICLNQAPHLVHH
jgi:hypothetical protein